MLPIPNGERKTIIYHKENGESNEDIARWIRVSVSTITRIWKQYITTGSCEPKPQNSGRKPLVTKHQMEMVVEKIKEQPDITLREMIDEFSLGISASALCRRLLAMGFTLKKRHFIQ